MTPSERDHFDRETMRDHVAAAIDEGYIALEPGESVDSVLAGLRFLRGVPTATKTAAPVIRTAKSAARSKVHFDPTVASVRTVREVVEKVLEKHAAFIADRVRIDANADRRRRALGAVERRTAIIEPYGVGFSRRGRIQTLLSKGCITDGHRLEIDRVCDAVEAAAVEKGTMS